MNHISLGLTNLGLAMNHINELQTLLSQILDWNKARISCLTQILQALICVQTVNLAQISTLFKNSAKPESSYRRARRFFANFVFDRTVLIPIVFALFSLKKDLILILDRTNWKWGKKDINILLLSVGYKGIGIPLFWTVSTDAGTSSTQERIDLLKKALEYIGKNRIKAFLADREFIGEEWFRFLKKQKIPFVIRIKKNSMAGGIRQYYQIPIIELWRGRGRTHKIVNYPVLIWGHLLYASISQAKGAEEPMIVVSNYEFSDAITLYCKRWEIEVLFSCLKTRGFRMEDTHITSPERIEKLLFVLTIAFCWSYKLGVIQATKKPIPLKTHGRPSKSFFRLGLDCLRSIMVFIERKLDDFHWAIGILSNCILRR